MECFKQGNGMIQFICVKITMFSCPVRGVLVPVISSSILKSMSEDMPLRAVVLKT